VVAAAGRQGEERRGEDEDEDEDEEQERKTKQDEFQKMRNGERQGTEQ
jgi:hypothetical protein